MKVLIIDDEKRARSVLRLLLEESCPEISLISEAANLPGGVRFIRSESPDLVFLDIEMPEYSGLKLFDFISPDEIQFDLVFTTAYSEFAIRAFEMNAVDYLLKPLQEDQVTRAVSRVAERRKNLQIDARLQELERTLRSGQIRKIGLPLADGTMFVEIADVILCKAERMYTRVFVQGEGEILVSKPLRYFLEKLAPQPGFFQSHRSFLVNLQHIKLYSTRDGGFIEMVNGEIAGISRENRDELQRLLSL